MSVHEQNCNMKCTTCHPARAKAILLHKMQCLKLLTAVHYWQKAVQLQGNSPADKAIHALLKHGYATFNMIIPGP